MKKKKGKMEVANSIASSSLCLTSFYHSPFFWIFPAFVALATGPGRCCCCYCVLEECESSSIRSDREWCDDLFAKRRPGITVAI
jgi:hypothetical protein